MRSLLRFVLTFLSSVVVASFLLCILFPTSLNSGSDFDHDTKSGLRGWFSFGDPVSLFSPTATISLTDDNSTFFNAKPAAFGPLLPSYGLSGQVWVGSGFGDDSGNRRGMAFTMEGELGCADIPGWNDQDWVSGRRRDIVQLKVSSRPPTTGNLGSKSTRRDSSRTQPKPAANIKDMPDEADGTDNYLHWPLHETHVAKQHSKQAQISQDNHADIQSLQEAAEIQGKVVMLSRGGCGFSEKIKWAQRRGASAVIVADNVPGGPLVRMYAKSDISNITIPSLFTSHTTAHLLSHLLPPLADSDGAPNAGKKFASQSSIKSSATTTNVLKLLASDKVDDLKMPEKSPVPDAKDSIGSSDNGLLSALGVPTRARVRGGATEKSPMVETDVPKKSWLNVLGLDNGGTWGFYNKESERSASRSGDDFVIGVQDWRDPDVVHVKESKRLQSASSSSIKATSTSSVRHNLKGGSITPGSGEYERPETQASHKALLKSREGQTGHKHKSSRKSWFGRLFSASSDPSDAYTPPTKIAGTRATAVSGVASTTLKKSKKGRDRPDDSPEQHYGLWVTLTPTDMNVSPFFNTLFVLVVSPLITLAIVYSMLLLRGRYRRRRWRAPKSVVERLPVRVYQALSSRASPVEEAPTAAATSTTPLLAGSRPTNIPSRPRSRAASAAAASSSMPSTSQYGSLGLSGISAAEQEKTASGLAEWKRKYGGKQKECVVCLEEYIDGVSRVMSLPCGHEFHADCM